MGTSHDRHRAPRLGSRDLHRLREVRDLLSAQRHPDEGLRARDDRRCPRRVPPQAVPLPRSPGSPPHHPGGARRLHGVRGVRRRVPGQVEGAVQPQGARHGPRRRRPRRRATPLRVLLRPALPRSALAPPRHHQGQPGPRAAVRVLRGVRRVRRDAVPPPAEPALRRSDGGGQRHGLLLDLRRQPAHHPLERQRRRVGGRRGRTRCSRTTPSSGSGSASATRCTRPRPAGCSTSSATGWDGPSRTRSSTPTSGPTPTSAPSASGSWS